MRDAWEWSLLAVQMVGVAAIVGGVVRYWLRLPKMICGIVREEDESRLSLRGWTNGRHVIANRGEAHSSSAAVGTYLFRIYIMNNGVRSAANIHVHMHLPNAVGEATARGRGSEMWTITNPSASDSVPVPVDPAYFEKLDLELFVALPELNPKEWAYYDCSVTVLTRRLNLLRLQPVISVRDYHLVTGKVLTFELVPPLHEKLGIADK